MGQSFERGKKKSRPLRIVRQAAIMRRLSGVSVDANQGVPEIVVEFMWKSLNEAAALNIHLN